MRGHNPLVDGFRGMRPSRNFRVVLKLWNAISCILRAVSQKNNKDHKEMVITNINFTADILVQSDQVHYKKRTTVVNIGGHGPPSFTIKGNVPHVPRFPHLWHYYPWIKQCGIHNRITDVLNSALLIAKWWVRNIIFHFTMKSFCNFRRMLGRGKAWASLSEGRKIWQLHKQML